MKMGILKKKGFSRSDLNKALSLCKEMTYASEIAKAHFREVSRDNDDSQNRRLIVFIHNWSRALEGELAQGHNINQRVASEICDILDKGGWLSGSEYQFIRSELLLHWRYSEMIMTEKEKKKYREDAFYKALHQVA